MDAGRGASWPQGGALRHRVSLSPAVPVFCCMKVVLMHVQL